MAVITRTTPCGEIEGDEDETSLRFLGIRFGVAKRFEKPELVDHWDGLYQAHKNGPCCPQFRAFYDEKKDFAFYYHEFREGLSFTYSEDCLFLDLYAPKNAIKAPVILHFFGGSFTRGSSGEKPIDGKAFAEKGVIFVAGSYRLNAFGKVIYQKSPQNLSLWDMLTALAWLKKNVASFGGDPDNITVMGQSAGAISLQTLLFNPEFRKQVQGAILLSGGGFRKGLFAPKNPRWIKKFSKRLHGNLKELGIKELYDEFHQAETKDRFSSFALLPSYDGDLVKKSDHQAIPKAMPPLILGTVQNEVLGPRFLRKKALSYQKHSSSPVYIYHFEHALPGGEKNNFHSCDLWYAMNSLHHSWRPFTGEDEALAERMVSYFANFAKHHDPNADQLPFWDKKGEMIFK